MEKVQRVIVYGKTLVLAGLEASLVLDPDCEVIGHAQNADMEELCALKPDVLIFDMNAMEPEILLAQLQAEPRLLLIGIDPESHEVLLTGQAAGSLSLDQITQIVRSRETDFTQPSGADMLPE